MPTTLDSAGTRFRLRPRRPAASPAASSVAYVAERFPGGPTALFVAPIDGTGEGTGAHLSFGGEPAVGSVTAFAWSPDRRSLAAIGRLAADAPAALWLADATTGAARRVAADLHPSADVRDFAWSADGARLEFVAAEADSGRLGLFIADVAGGIARATDATTPDGHRLVEACEGHAAEPSEVLARRSPDETRIAFVADAEERGRFDLFVRGPGSIDRRRISSGLHAGDCVEAFEWAFGGSRLVFVVANWILGTRSLQSADASGIGTVLDLAASIVSHAPHEPAFRLAADGRTAVYRAEDGSRDRHTLRAVAVAGGPSRLVSDPAAGHGRIHDFMPS